MTDGDHGEAYVENRLSAGTVHERIGLPVKAYLGMCGFSLRAVTVRLREDIRNDSQRRANTSLERVVPHDNRRVA